MKGRVACTYRCEQQVHREELEHAIEYRKIGEIDRNVMPFSVAFR